MKRIDFYWDKIADNKFSIDWYTSSEYTFRTLPEDQMEIYRKIPQYNLVWFVFEIFGYKYFLEIKTTKTGKMRA